MTDDELTRRVDRLERRVDRLEDRFSERQTTNDGTLDRYDADAIQYLVEHEDEVFPVRTVRGAYKRAGIRNSKKITERVRHLVEAGHLGKDDQWFTLGERVTDDTDDTAIGTGIGGE